jgi:WD repeat-containing protein 20
MNLFLASHSSGCIYLYDANNQSQSAVAPVYNKFYADDSFTLNLNSNFPTQTAVNSIAQTAHVLQSNTKTTTTPITASLTNPKIPDSNKKLNGHFSQTNTHMNPIHNPMHNIMSTPNIGGSTQACLILSSANQQTTTQVAKNPLLKWTIGSSCSEGLLPPNSPSTALSLNSSYSINELAFSPCGTYLAIVSQDGYLRVFTFIFESLQNMQIQLRCSMKSYFGGLLCVCWSSDGKYIATGGEDDLITIFSFNECRVVCRGRGHRSWINCCSFDPWTKLNNHSGGDSAKTNRIVSRKTTNTTFNESSDKEQIAENESDLEEDYLSQLKMRNLKLSENTGKLGETGHNQKQEKEKMQQKLLTNFKKRTISTLSDCNYSVRDGTSDTETIYYRLASCGQDNHICFWDLTEDVLKERPIQHSRSRLTSIGYSSSSNTAGANANLPQIVIQQSIYSHDENRNASNLSTGPAEHTSKHHHHHHHGSILSSARHLFSSKHSEKTPKSQQEVAGSSADLNISDDGSSKSSTSSGILSSTASNIFGRRNKRNPSNSSDKSRSSKSSNAQVTLNSYKKALNTINSVSSITTENSIANSVADSYASTKADSGIGASFKKSSTLSTTSTNGTNNSNSPFDLCPKLDEIPIIEPLICKRITNERLTSIQFKEDCFLVATQDGFVYTWARPSKVSLILSIKLFK